MAQFGRSGLGGGFPPPPASLGLNKNFFQAGTNDPDENKAYRPT